MRDLGIHVTIVEPGAFSTDWGGPSSVQAEQLPAYDGIRATRAEMVARRGPRGVPEATGPAILKLVDAAEPPLRVFFGRGALDMLSAEYAGRIALWEQWDDVSVEAHGNPE